MKQLFEKFIENFYVRVTESNLEKIKISDFCFEFKNKEVCYAIKYVSPCIILETNNNKVCEWLLDKDASKKYLEDVLEDFVNIILKKKPECAKKEMKIIKDQKETNVNKMADKLLHFFPNFRENYFLLEKISEKISFFNNKIMPEINNMICRTKDDNKTERMFKNLCDDYVFGDSQTRCIVTMLFFRGIKNKKSRKKIRNLLPNYMKKTWDATLRVK
ncbi:MAG: hypothetical protein J6P21_02445 [Clostridia bacterium]|nr:hypothetical protein [Clostridia bacterium]